jgi:O-antigen/teichoic acid export membrane protein
MATESLWSLTLEGVSLFTVILSFYCLGRTLGPEGYGGYASLYALIGPLVTLAASGVILALLQHAIRDGEPLGETARSCVSLSLSIGAVLLVVGGGLAFVIVEALETTAIVAILCTEFLTAPLVHIAAATVQAGQGYTGAAQIRLVLVVGRATILVLLFAVDALTVSSLGLSQLALTAVLAIVVMGRVGRQFDFDFRPGRVHLRHLKTNAVYSVAISAFSLQNDGDKTVLAANRFTVDTGLYAAAYRIIGLGLIPLGSVVEVSHKRFLEKGEGRPGRHLRLAMKLSGLMSLYSVVFIVAIIIAAPALPLVVGDEFEGSVEMLRWISPLVLLRCLAMFPLNGLMGLGRTGLRTILIVVVAVLTMTLYIVLIPRHGWEGAVAGTMIGDTVLVVAAWVSLVVHQRRADRAMEDPVPEEAVARSAPQSP